ncbi:heme-degrading domain-containing protein [Cryobacterium zhongshanensis]|uniref:Heme-degrading domain-containing protein n=1 Tax=Cryobacterium zhongshanensis TaxID=2928153 RepID=A0AA41QZ84_9MICO|nr:heme-degrading domain-containing protein [Cryobacterium zhongshanensis]MCI4659143.1 heme-degrading domain-containing protein [Cryobacterium zhongshanensis]
MPHFLEGLEMTDAPTLSAEEQKLEILLEQERSIQFDSFGFADAWAVGTLLVELGLERDHPIAIAIMFGDQRVFHASLPGASADNDGWLENKFRVVRRFASSSLAVGTRFRAAGRDFDTSSRLDPRTHAAHGGAFPLRVRGALMGVVGVSGLAQQLDHDLVVEALTAHRAQQLTRG